MIFFFEGNKNLSLSSYFFYSPLFAIKCLRRRPVDNCDLKEKGEINDCATYQQLFCSQKIFMCSMLKKRQAERCLRSDGVSFAYFCRTFLHKK